MEIRSILVPVDGSELSLKAADAAAALAQRLVATVTLLTVADPPEAARAYVSRETMEDLRRGVQQASEAILNQAADRIRAMQPHAQKRLVWGSAPAAIAAEAEKGYQLIVMGSRGIGLEPADRQLLGSVAERVLRRTRCPVLIIPGREEP